MIEVNHQIVDRLGQHLLDATIGKIQRERSGRETIKPEVCGSVAKLDIHPTEQAASIRSVLDVGGLRSETREVADDPTSHGECRRDLQRSLRLTDIDVGKLRLSKPGRQKQQLVPSAIGQRIQRDSPLVIGRAVRVQRGGFLFVVRRV